MKLKISGNSNFVQVATLQISARNANCRFFRASHEFWNTVYTI